MINYRWGIIALLLALLTPLGTTQAVEQTTAVISPPYTSLKGKDCDITLRVPALLRDEIDIRKVSTPQGNSLSQSGPTLISNLCQFDVADDSLYDSKFPLHISMNYSDDKGHRPRIYYWDGGKQQWNGLPSVMNRVEKIVTADIHLAYARVAIMVEETGMYEGTASWYADRRYSAGAATDRYPVGTRLKVTNLSNGKTTVVVTTSTWDNPDKKRVIDLVKTAFATIADPKQGLVRVRIEKLF